MYINFIKINNADNITWTIYFPSNTKILYVATVYIVIIKLLLLKVSSRSKGQVLNVHILLANLSAVLTIQTCKSMITSSNKFNYLITSWCVCMCVCMCECACVCSYIHLQSLPCHHYFKYFSSITFKKCRNFVVIICY